MFRTTHLRTIGLPITPEACYDAEAMARLPVVSTPMDQESPDENNRPAKLGHDRGRLR